MSIMESIFPCVPYMYVALLSVTKDTMYCCIGMQLQSHHCCHGYFVLGGGGVLFHSICNISNVMENSGACADDLFEMSHQKYKRKKNWLHGYIPLMSSVLVHYSHFFWCFVVVHLLLLLSSLLFLCPSAFQANVANNAKEMSYK